MVMKCADAQGRGELCRDVAALVVKHEIGDPANERARNAKEDGKS